jgi:hypothetical protein
MADVSAFGWSTSGSSATAPEGTTRWTGWKSGTRIWAAGEWNGSQRSEHVGERINVISIALGSLGRLIQASFLVQAADAFGSA